MRKTYSIFVYLINSFKSKYFAFCLIIVSSIISQHGCDTFKEILSSCTAIKKILQHAIVNLNKSNIWENIQKFGSNIIPDFPAALTENNCSKYPFKKKGHS